MDPQFEKSLVAWMECVFFWILSFFYNVLHFRLTRTMPRKVVSFGSLRRLDDRNDMGMHTPMIHMNLLSKTSSIWQQL